MIAVFRLTGLLLLGLSFRAVGEERYFLDFKEFEPKTAKVKFINNLSKTACKTTPEGLEIDIPAGRKEGPIAGFTLPFALGGDFEVTLRYDRFKADPMPKGNGGMISIWLSIESDPEKGATMTRAKRADGDLMIANHVSFDEAGKEKYNAFFFPASADAGAIRLKRTGSVIHHMSIDGDKGEWKDLHSWGFGKEDVVALRFQLNPSGLDKTASCRFLDFDVKADSFGGPQGRPATKKANVPVAKAVEGGDAVEPAVRFPRWLLIAIPFVLGILAALFYLLFQGRKNAPGD